MKRCALLMVCLLVSVGCRATAPSAPIAGSQPKPQPSHPSTASSPATASGPRLLATYEGLLPCADCSGIRTELLLYAKAPDDSGDATYRLTQTYLGAPGGDRSFDTSGHWSVVQGTSANPDAVVYLLFFDRPGEMFTFLRVSDDELRLLDRERNEIPSQANHTLRRVNSTNATSSTSSNPSVNPGGFEPLTAADEQARLAANFAVAEQSRRRKQEIRLLDISRAERQIVAGANYRLCLDVRTESGSQSALTVVCKDLRGQYALSSWTFGPC